LADYESYKATSFCEYLFNNKLMIKDLNELEKFATHFGPLDTRKIVEIVNVMTGMKWYQCPNRHVYAVGECGRPVEEAKCPECESSIGGNDHILILNNRQIEPNNINNNN